MSRALLFLLLAGCGRVADWGTPRYPGATLPHPAGWEEAGQHGTSYLERGQAACADCHEPDAFNSFCGECHQSYPHADGWLEGAQHGGGTYGEFGELQPCQDCHELSASQAGSLPCTACHASYPHPEAWEGRGQHGAYLVQRGGERVVCAPCHGDDLDGAEVSGACTDCHASYPHPQGWERGEAHGHFEGLERQGAAAAGCLGCHAQGSGQAGVACARCHASYPHGLGWGAAHAKRVVDLGEGSCIACHDPGDGPTTMPASCAPVCHGGKQ